MIYWWHDEAIGGAQMENTQRWKNCGRCERDEEQHVMEGGLSCDE